MEKKEKKESLQKVDWIHMGERRYLEIRRDRASDGVNKIFR